ncbi:MAG: TIGR03986 family CRISPR-associated RAMP protein [Sulfurimonas sp.]|uniref:TIGR03986 family type III CRISPR-associated RAMP protein n=1 Tax=Sulfurimonas sp. TaxID=2022749 RepID=UPI003D0FC802
MITAPYNFVPLNKEIFYPSWSEDVSHDVPFEDGESGEIEITITARSPIFIRDHTNPEEFCQHNGEYYIPSTSVKGMVRNVLEIMSFSKMRAEIFDDDTYAVRDLSKADNFYMSEMKKPTFGGWLKKIGNEYKIEDCGEVGRIRHEEIDKALEVKFSKHFKQGAFQETNQEHKSSKYKYKLIENKDRVIKLSESFKSKTNAKYDNRVFYNYDKNGKKEGILVLTGQPTPRKDSGKMGDGKGYEFIFFASKGDLSVSKEVMDNFKFAYFDKRTTEPKESPDWTYWKEKLENGEKVPVFFQKNGNQVKHFGLSYLYKLPYTHSVKDGIPKSHFENDDLDLAQTIFGYIGKNNKEALKGRVQFSHFKAISNANPLAPRKEILGTPRASYYPIYVRQIDGKRYATFMDDYFELAGRKRYPIHNSSQTTKTTDTGNDNVGTSFTPLKDGVVFKGKLRYHNLKKAELGAILSALTFHNMPNTFHNIGLAKSLGYGKIQVKIDGIKEIKRYLKEFELTIEEQIADWAQTMQIKELLSMAIEQQNQGNSKLKYLELAEFAKNKTGENKDYLRNYTSLNNIKTVAATSLLSKEDKELLKIRKVEQEKQKAQKIEAKKEQAKVDAMKKEEENQLKDALECTNIQTIKNFILKYPQNEGIDKLKHRITILETALQESKFASLNQEVQKAWDNIHNPAYKSKLKSALDGFIKKYSEQKNHKGSEYILELVEKAKLEFKQGNR